MAQKDSGYSLVLVLVLSCIRFESRLINEQLILAAC